MGLAAAKTRQRINNDPRNTKWSNDKNRFAFKLMQKMGWQEGQGLGMDARGQLEHVRIEQKQDLLGIGAKKDNSENWLENTDAFNQLLASLNQEYQQQPQDEQREHGGTTTSTTTVVTSEHRLLHRKKYVNAKREALFDQQGMNAIIGLRNSSSSVDIKESGKSVEVNTLDSVQTQISTLSTAEYFRQRMESLKMKNQISSSSTSQPDAGKNKDKKDKKRKHRESRVDAEDLDEKKRRKKEKKEKKKDRKEKEKKKSKSRDD